MPELPIHKLFPLLFMMTGPLRVVPAFAVLAVKFDAPTRNRLALRAVIVAAIGILLSVFIGVGVLKAWSVSPPGVGNGDGNRAAQKYRHTETE